MSFRVMQSLLENALARDELVRTGLSFWPGHARPKPGGLRRRPPFTVGDSRKSWDVLATLRLLEAERLQNETIVDFGAFASEILCCLHRAEFKRLVGIDLNPAVKDMPFADAIEWRVGDMMATGLPAGSAGAVTSISAIEHGFDLEQSPRGGRAALAAGRALCRLDRLLAGKDRYQWAPGIRDGLVHFLGGRDSPFHRRRRPLWPLSYRGRRVGRRCPLHRLRKPSVHLWLVRPAQTIMMAISPRPT